MPKFIVKAWETADATYAVEADSKGDARDKVEAIGRIEEDTLQIDFDVFEVDVRSIDEVDG